MTFRPQSGTTATEKVEDVSLRGYTFSDVTKQHVQGGTIRMLPQLTGDFQRQGAKWPALAWDILEDFPPLPEEVKQRWGYLSSAGKTLGFSSYSKYLRFNVAGDIEVLFQTRGGAAGKTRFADNVDNAIGYVIETRVEVVSSPTGDVRDGISLVFDDGAIRDEIKFAQDRIYLESDPEIGISGVFSTPTDFRVMVRGSDIWMWAEGQDGLTKTGTLTQASTIKSLQLGAPRSGITADVRFDYLYQRYLWTTDIPVALATGFGFDTTTQSTQLPIHAPARAVSSWDKAIVETMHGESNLEIGDPWVFSDDFDDKGDNTDLFVTEPENWEVLFGVDNGMNVDFDGSDGVVWSSAQYVRFVGGQGNLKPDHYVQFTHAAARVSDGSFVADATPRYNPYVILRVGASVAEAIPGDDEYFYVVNWGQTYDGSQVNWTIRIWNASSNVATLATLVQANDGTKNPIDGRKMRVEIHGEVISVYNDFLDGAGLVKMLEVENTTEFVPPSDGDVGLWLGPLLLAATQAAISDIEIGNFEGESSTTIGTTRLRVEYSNDRGATFSLAKVESIATVPFTNVDLSLVPAVGSGMDALRLTVEQLSPGGLAKPIRVKQVTVKAVYDTSGVSVYPDWGPKIGGTSVAATLLPDAKQNFGSIPQLSALTAYGSEGATSPLTGDYNTITDFPGHGQAYGTPTLVGTPTCVLDAIAVEGEGVYGTLSAQAVHAGDGEGLLYSKVTDTGRQLLRGYLAVQRGSVRVELDSDVHVFRKGTYVDLRTLGVLWESTGAMNLGILGNEAGSIWKHRLESTAPWTYAPAEIDASADAHSGLEGWVYVEGIGTGQQPVYSTLNGTGVTSGMEVGFDADGRPYVRVRDALGVDDSVTGEFPLTVGEIAHIAGGFTGYDDGVALQVFKNGEICGQKRTQIQASQIIDGRPRDIAARPGTTGIDPRSAVRCSQGSGEAAPDARRVVAEQGIANPVFELDRNWPVRSTTRLLLDLDRKEGSVYDRSGYGNYPVIPEAYRRRTQRGADGFWGRSTFFVAKEGGMQVPWSAGLNPDTGMTVSLFAKVFTDPNELSTLWSQVNESGDGWEIDVDLEGRASFVVYDSSSTYTHTHTGALLGIDVWRPAMFKYDPAAGSVRSRVGNSAWEESSGFPAIADQSGVSHWIGRGTFGLLDNLSFHRELLSDALYTTLIDESAKYTPDEDVTIRGVTVTGVRHWGIDQKFFQTPEGAVGEADVAISAYGASWPAVRPFLYSDTYDRVIDKTTIVGQVCSTTSPFRIGNKVPLGGVNLALINSPSMSVPGNVGFTDLSANEIANIAFYNQGDFVIQDPAITGEDSGEFFYGPSIDTEEIRISNRSVMRKNFKQPKPLFYMHLIGRGRRYVYHPDANGSADADLIRQNLRIETYEGAKVEIEDFGWDIEVQTVDYYNNFLPAHYFSVILYCERVPHGETLFVVYDGADARQGYLRDLSRREAINPVPIFTKIPTGDTIDDFEYSMDLDTGGAYSLRVDRS